MEFTLSEKANGSGYAIFLYVSNKIQNGDIYWKCDEYVKCESCILSTVEEDSLMKAQSERSNYISSYLRAAKQNFWLKQK